MWPIKSSRQMRNKLPANTNAERCSVPPDRSSSSLGIHMPATPANRQSARTTRPTPVRAVGFDAVRKARISGSLAMRADNRGEVAIGYVQGDTAQR